MDIKSVTIDENKGQLNYAFTPYDPNGNYTFAKPIGLPDPGREALQRATPMAEPWVNAAGEV